MQTAHTLTRKKKLLRIIGLVAVCCGAYLFWRTLNVRTSRSVVSPLPDNYTYKPQNVFLSKIFGSERKPENLKVVIEKIAHDNSWRNYSVLVVDYSSDFKLDIGGSIIYPAASVNKIPIIAALYYAYQNGDVDMDETITLQAQDIQDYGTGSIRYDSPGTTYSVKTLARLMMEQSDNTAAYLLANHVVGLNVIQRLVDGWGLTQTDMTKNLTSNSDMSILMDKMYHGKITNPANTKELLSLLTHSDFEDRIPALLPKTATVYHKIGNGVGSVHDVGIVEEGKRMYYIGILTSDITDDAQGAKTASQISKAVYDFLN